MYNPQPSSQFQTPISVRPRPTTEPKSSQHYVSRLFKEAGVDINGTKPCDIRVYNSGFYDRVLAQGSLGLGESYIDGWWDCPDLAECINLVLRAELEKQAGSWSYLLQYTKAKLFNLQSAGKVMHSGGAEHYDLGNDFYRSMLDPEMLYTCGYWKNAENLSAAQTAKVKLVCDKLGLQPGMKVLDIGCGWGGFLRYATKHYGVTGVGVSISKEQIKYARDQADSGAIEYLVKDYRDLDGQFDRIVSLGMFEHVGQKNYREFMKVMARHLSPNGLALLHTIGSNTSEITTDAWMDKYIFPDGMLPSIAQIGKSIEGIFVMEDWHNFGPDYDKTLLAWYDNFQNNWPEFHQDLGHQFFRKWKYYLLSCAGSFRARKTQLWQIVLSPKGEAGISNHVRSF